MRRELHEMERLQEVSQAWRVSTIHLEANKSKVSTTSSCVVSACVSNPTTYHRWYCRYLKEEWDTAMSRSHDIAVLKRDAYRSGTPFEDEDSTLNYKNSIQGTVLVLKRVARVRQPMSENDRWLAYNLAKKNRKLGKWGGVGKRARKRLEKKYSVSKRQEVHPTLPPNQAVKKKRTRTTQDTEKKRKANGGNPQVHKPPC